MHKVLADIMEYPGPFCEKINIDKICISSGKIPDLSSSHVNNGVIVELFRYASKSKIADKNVETWISQLLPSVQSLKQSTLRARLKKVKETQRKFESKKKVANFPTIEDFHTTVFFLNEKALVPHPLIETVTETQNVIPQCPSPLKLKETETQNVIPQCPSPLKETETQNVIPQLMPIQCPSTVKESQKTFNELKYKVIKEQKKLKMLKSLVLDEKESLEHIKSIKGHFSVRNVTKRDEHAKSTRQSLRALKMSFSKQKHILETFKNENKDLCSKMQQYESKHAALLNDNERLKDVSHQRTKAQKLTSYYRGALQKLRDLDHSESNKRELKRKQDEIDWLVNENEKLNKSQTNCMTKNDDGSFSNNLRLCVMELFGLEVGMEKIPSAIEAVSKHMFNYELKTSDLPTLTTVRNIVDEGHYLAKTFIAKKIEAADNIGISRDGTTRKKEKIIDLAVTLSTGEVMSVGYTKVARETAQVINNVTKTQMNELAETVAETSEGTDQENTTVQFIANSLEKLSFTMSDRASNEKLANKLLNEWRDSVLEKSKSVSEKLAVSQFYCMAHVLLGFHKYVTDDLKKFEKVLTSSQGPVGRDRLPYFKFWSKKQTIVERIAYTSSGIFGPTGDHLGLRDRWEAYCASNGVKSLIGNYKDNRFNSLFQTSAEVYLHSDNFLRVIETVPNPNQKIQSVEADLKCQTVQTMLRALTIAYLKVTGPYWWLVTSGKSSYLQLYPHVQRLESYLEKCAEDPNCLHADTTWILDDDLLVPHSKTFYDKLATPLPIDQSDTYHELLTLICKSMLRTVRKQLCDFLQGGCYSTVPSKEDLTRTAFAQVTNLACKHHFGDLDSSQRRRPNATFHHHSSVQLLKRNRRQLIGWMSDMPDNEKNDLMKKARKGGSSLRKRHRDQENSVQEEILEMMEKGKDTKRRKLNVSACDSDEEDYEGGTIVLNDLLPNMDGGFQENEYVAIAYQDAWYPGVVVKIISNEQSSVNFMTPCRKPGTYMWPSRKDIQIVEKQFVLKRGMVPECKNSGRQWYFPDFNAINDLFAKYQLNFF